MRCETRSHRNRNEGTTLNDTKRVIALGFFDGAHTGHGAC